MTKLEDFEDEGRAVYLRGTASTTVFTIIDFINGTVVNAGDLGGVPNHPVRGYSIKNRSSTDSIFIAHNVARNSAQVDVDIVDTTKANSPFLLLEPLENESANYFTKKINNIFILAQTGSPNWKLKVVW